MGEQEQQMSTAPRVDGAADTETDASSSSWAARWSQLDHEVETALARLDLLRTDAAFTLLTRLTQQLQQLIGDHLRSRS